MAPTLPPINAKLTKVQAPDLVDDYTGEVLAPGAVRWEGEAPAYVTEQVVIETARGTVDQLVVTRVAIPSRVEVSTGDRLTFVKGGQTTTRTARNLEERSDFGFTRIYFHDA